jgi:hypothetical protein
MYNRGEIMDELERLTLLDWAKSIIPRMICLTNNRYNYTLLKNDMTIHPLVWTIKNRLINKEGLDSCLQEPTLKDFLSILPESSFIHKHTDANHLNLLHVRFNVFIQVPRSGGITYYDDHIVDTYEGSYVLSRSGIDEHWSTVIEGDKSRIALSYGFLISSQKLDELTSNKKIGIYRYYPLTHSSQSA